MPDYKLQNNEIYLKVSIKKHNSDSNYFVFQKYLNGYDYEKAYFILPKMVKSFLNPKNNKEGWREIFNNIEIYSRDVGSPVIKINNEYKDSKVIYRYDKIEKHNSGLEVDFHTIIDQNTISEHIFDPAILSDPSLISMVCLPRLEYIGGNGTTNYITEFKKKNPNFVPLKKDFLKWFIVIAPMTHPDRIKLCPYSDEIVLAAPYFKKQVLPSGSILLQMTEKTDFTKFDQEYWDKLMELYQYFIDKPMLE